MSILDLIVIAIFIFFIAYYYVRGFAVAIMSFFAYILAFFLASFLYPFLASFLRNIGNLFENLQNWVSRTLGLDGMAYRTGESIESFMETLNLPQFVQNHISRGYNEESRLLLNVDSFGEFISAFIAGAIINIIAMVVAFVLALAVIRIGIHMVGLVAKLPILRQVNKLFGAILGGFMGLFASWAVLTVLVWVFGSNPSFNVNQMLQNSLIAGALQQINIISRLIANV